MSVIITLSNSYKQSANRCPMGLTIAKNGPKMAKNGCFWPFSLDSSSSTVTTSILVLENVRYYYTEQYIQTWSARRCFKGLIIAKNSRKMAKNSWFWQSRLDSSSSTVTTSLLVLQNVRYYHTEHYLQTWSAHRCLKGLIITKNGPKLAKYGCFLPIMSTFFLIVCYYKFLSVAKCQVLSYWTISTNIKCP